MIGHWLLENSHKVSELILICYSENTDQTHILEKIKEDTNHTLRFLAHSLMLNSPKSFINYTRWLREIMHSLNFSDESIVNSYEFIKDALESFHPVEALKTAFDFINQALDILNFPTKSLENQLIENNPMKDIVSQYTQHILAKEEDKAYKLLKTVLQEHSLEAVYLHILQASLYEIGSLWQQRKVTVAQEHYCVSTTEKFMNHLAPINFSNSQSTILTCSIGKETHDVGIKMIANLLAKDGFNTIHLGANTPLEALLDEISNQPIDIIVISATMLENVYPIKLFIEQLKDKEYNTKVFVGGQSFKDNEYLWKQIGADAYTRDASEVIHLIKEHAIS